MMKILTRYFLALALFALTIVSLPVKAEVSTQCSIDHAIKGALEFQQCPISDNDNDILNSGFDGVRLDAANSASQTPIWAFNTCRYADNLNATNALFIPLKSAQEWEAFIANPPANVHLAGCCIPRPMHVSDVPTPPTACAAGWVLKGLVDTGNHKKLIASPTSATTDSGFTLASGVSDDSSYPVLKLPINRDDIGAVLPDNSNPAKTYAALYSCGDKLDYYVDFHLQCKDTQWVSDNAPAPATTTDKTETTTETTTPADEADATDATFGRKTADVETKDNCVISHVRSYSKKCPSGSGMTSYRDVFNSCTKTIETQTIMSTCGTSGGINGGVNGGIGGIEGCFATSNTSTAPCPSNQAGSIKTRIDHICDGSNNGDGSDNVVILSNTCSNTVGGVACIPTDVLDTTPCPNATSGGIITLRRVHICDGSNNGTGSTTQTVVANNCTAGGCMESTILKTSTVCPGGMLTTAKVYNSCTKLVSNVTVSNTCN